MSRVTIIGPRDDAARALVRAAFEGTRIPVVDPPVVDPPAAVEKRRAQLEAEGKRTLADGDKVVNGDDTVYVVSNLRHLRSMTLTRAIPKIRGKKARKALKKQRQRLNQQGNGLDARRKYVDVDWNVEGGR